MSEERARRAKLQDGGDVGKEEQDDEILHPTPLEAMNSGLSLLELGMPGVLTLERLKEEIDLDSMKIHPGQGKVHLASNITVWDSGDEMNSSTLKGIFAEFAAVLGPVLAKEVIVDFGS